jgi:hypothetical protein
LGPVGHINVASGFGHWPAVDRLATSLYRAMAETDLPIVSPIHFAAPLRVI